MNVHHGIGLGEHLDATGERKVVYCHHCANEWWQDQHGLVCPNCDGEVTEVVEPGHDPRDMDSQGGVSPSLRDLHNHSPWGSLSPDSDPEEADIEEHITRGPNGSIVISQTIRSSPVRRSSRTRPEPSRRRSSYLRDRDRDHDDSNRHFAREFQSMMEGLMEPNGPPPRPRGRNFEDHFPRRGGNDALPWQPLFSPRDQATSGSGSGRGFTFSTHEGPGLIGSRVTFSSSRIGGPGRSGLPGDPPVTELATLLSNLFGNMIPPPPGGDHQARDGPAGRPAAPNFSALLAALMNPANAASGDAVYTQEALDRVISQLMEAHPTSSSAPGPAAPQTISSLPKRNLTDQDLEGNKKVIGKNGVEEMKGECSVCMDDVGVGEEMVFLPCKHWFHEVCASAWLSEHDSCPICRMSISGDSNSNSNAANTSTNGNGNENGGAGSRSGSYRRQSGSMGAGFGSNWGSNNPFTAASSNAPSNSSSSSGWGSPRPSIFTTAGRRERRREQEQEAERTTERNVEGDYLARLPERERERERRMEDERNGSGIGGHSRWTSQSASNNDDGNLNGSSWSSRGGTSGAGLWGIGSGRNRDRLGADRSTTNASRRYSNYSRVTPQRRESDGNGARARSTSPPDRPMPGTFSPSPPRRTSTRSSRSGSGSGSGNSGGGGGGVLNWVRDRFPGGGSRRGGSGGDTT